MAGLPHSPVCHTGVEREVLETDTDPLSWVVGDWMLNATHEFPYNGTAKWFLVFPVLGQPSTRAPELTSAVC